LFRGAVSGAEAGASVLVGQFGAYSK